MALIKLNNRGVRNVTTFGSVSGGSFTFIKKLTASSSATLSFLDGSASVVFDDTYKEYIFTFNNIHPATSDAYLTFQADTGTNTSYNQTVTSSFFFAQQGESNDPTLAYATTRDLAQSTNFIPINIGQNNDNDGSASGYIHLFNPSSSTFVIHFICRSVEMMSDPGVYNSHAAGYFNTTTALTRVQFKMSSGNMDAGDICLYGIK